MMQTRYLSIQDVAKRFGVNVTTVYHLAQQGTLPGFKVGNQWRFSQEMLDLWVAEQVAGKTRASNQISSPPTPTGRPR